MTMTTTALRPELQALPPRLQRLPVDARGYPVPWFVQWVRPGTVEPVSSDTPDAVPEFRLMDQAKWVRAVQERRCWVCGDTLGVYLTFVVGPMCGLNRTTAEPPCHRDCAEWSARNCPFLARPQMVRRTDALTESLAVNVAGEMLARNPGVTLLWTTKTFSVWRDDKGAPLITMGEALTVQWFAEGRAATRAEVEASVESGYPHLFALADAQQRAEGVPARDELAKQRAAFEHCYPEGDERMTR